MKSTTQMYFPPLPITERELIIMSLANDDITKIPDVKRAKKNDAYKYYIMKKTEQYNTLSFKLETLLNLKKKP